MRFTNVFTSKDCDNTIKGWIALLCTVIAYNPRQALASNFPDLAFGDVEQKGDCIALLQGFLSGYKMGYQNGTYNAQAAPSDQGPQLCVPSDLSPGKIYDDIYPHIPEGHGYLDMSLFVAALKTYPCEANQD